MRRTILAVVTLCGTVFFCGSCERKPLTPAEIQERARATAQAEAETEARLQARKEAKAKEAAAQATHAKAIEAKWDELANKAREEQVITLGDLKQYDREVMQRRWPLLRVIKVNDMYLHLEDEVYNAAMAKGSQFIDYDDTMKHLKYRSALQTPPMGLRELTRYDKVTIEKIHNDDCILKISDTYVRLEQKVFQIVVDNRRDWNDKLDCMALAQKLWEMNSRRELIELIASRLENSGPMPAPAAAPAPVPLVEKSTADPVEAEKK